MIGVLVIEKPTYTPTKLHVDKFCFLLSYGSREENESIKMLAQMACLGLTGQTMMNYT